MKHLVLLACLVFGALAAPAGAVNDPFVPAEDCAPANAQAVGHPAFANQADNPQGANPPFSSNNPGASSGARGAANSQAAAHCRGAL
jgi:hypothetical protein